MIIEATRANWGCVALADCCEIVSGGTPRRDRPEYWDGTIPWVTPKDLSGLESPLLNDTPEKITEAGYESSSARMLTAGAVLFSSRAPIGLVAIAGCSMCTNQGFKSFVPGPGIDSMYLYYCLKHHVPQIQSLGTGATFKEVSKKVVGAFDIPLPFPEDPERSLREQKRIAAILDKADAIRRQRQQAIQEAQSLIPAIFYDMFGDPGANPNNWPIRKVRDLLNPDGGTRCGPFGSALHKEDYTDEGVPVWGIDNVRPNLFVEKGSLFISPLKYDELTSYSVEQGDILISRAGTVGRMCVAYPKRCPSIIGTNLIRVRVRPEELVPEYLCALFTFFGSRLGSLRANPEESAYSFMKTEVMKSMSIPVPPPAVQQEFALRTAFLSGLDIRRAEALAEADGLFHSLTQRAFKGEL